MQSSTSSLAGDLSAVYICQSKRPCKCYGKELCVALSLKENIILCAVATPGHGRTGVIFAASSQPLCSLSQLCGNTTALDVHATDLAPSAL